MKMILFLLTELFPYGKNAEAFLEPEIKMTSKYFDHVYICPSSRKVKENEKRELDATNISLRPVKRGPLLAECIRSIPYILRHKGFWQDLKMLKQNNNVRFCTLKKLAFAIITEAAVHRHFKRLHSEIDKESDIVIYSYWLFGEAGGAIAIKDLFGNNAMTVSRGHGTDINGYETLQYYSPLKKYYLDGLDLVIPVSEKGKELLIEKYNKYEHITESVIGKIQPVHLGIEIDRDMAGTKTENEIFTIVSCSSLIPIKRVELIVEGLKNIRNRDVRWIHLGGGDLLDNIRELCKAELGSNISYEFKGPLARESVLKFYKDNYVDLFINVSSSEGIPVSIMEAFSYGIPAIATNVGSVSELCKDSFNGFLLSKDFNAVELSDSILKMIQLKEKNSDKYTAMRQNARETIIKDYSLDNYNKFYELLIDKVKGGYNG